MKKSYPNYFGKMKDIEENISQQNKEILDKYLKFCSLSASGYKIEQRKRYALQFLDITEKPFEDFDRDTIEHIYMLIKDTDREIIGKNEVIKNLKYFIRWYRDDENLIKGLKSIKQSKGYNTRKLNPSTLVKDEEIEILIRNCNSLKDRAMITLFIECGLRPIELLNLKWKDIRIDDDEVGEISIFSTKTNGNRVLPFKTCLIHIKRWRDEFEFPNRKQSDYVFPSNVRSKPLYSNYLAQFLRRKCDNLGIRRINPYLFRHTRITEANKKMPSKVASAYGGHSEKTSERYTHLSESDIREIVLKEMYDIKEPNLTNKQQEELKDLRKLKILLPLAKEYEEMKKLNPKGDWVIDFDVRDNNEIDKKNKLRK